MSYIVTPSDIDVIEALFRNPITGKWIVPILTFDVHAMNPFLADVEPLNRDPIYRRRVVENFYTRLTEKWLYKEPMYRRLLKYFKVSRTGDTGKVTLINDPDKPSDKHSKDDDRFIFKYIEKYFITRKFVKKVLKEYVKTTRINWYDLFNNTDTLKELLNHKLKKLIVSAIYQQQQES